MVMQVISVNNMNELEYRLESSWEHTADLIGRRTVKIGHSPS